ncbi:MAG TPA: hypothetical protein PLQ41_06415 [bacterium]|nr:hypothetical protein [bacterium]
MGNILETKNNNVADKASDMFSTGYGSLLFTSKGIENFRKRYDFKPTVEDEIKIRELFAAAEIAGITANMLRYTKLELKDYFTVDEAILICKALNGFSLDREISIKTKIYIEIEDYFKYTPFREDVCAEELLRKISNLTEFQCFVVAVMVNDFFAHRSELTDEDVKEIFNIEK